MFSLRGHRPLLDLATCSMVEGLCVAMITARPNLRAAPPRVERAVCPGDFGYFCHGYSRLFYLHNQTTSAGIGNIPKP